MRTFGLPARRTLIFAAAGLALWTAAGLLAGRLRALEEAEGVAPGRRSGGEAVASALGGFRGLVADFLWLRGIQLQDEGRFDELTLLYKLILDLQPHLTGVWAYHSWNFAYNLAYEAGTPQERWHWIKTGLDLLEKDGISRVPDSYHLYYELGHAYYFRVSAKGGDPFYRHYQERLAPVPSWCLDEFSFVDKGLWSDKGVRYRLYRKRFGAGKVTLGGASAPGGCHTRAKRMYVVAVSPAEALVSADRKSGPGLSRVRLTPVPLAEGAPLYRAPPRQSQASPWRHRDAQDQLEEFALHKLPRTPVREPSIPQELADAALVPLPDADRLVRDEDYLRLELSSGADVWIGWAPDETRGFLIAREWLLKAESMPDCPTLMPSRLRAWALVYAGQWERAYGEFVEQFRNRIPGDTAIESALLSFLRNSVYATWKDGRREEAASWHRRLRANFPSWTMSHGRTVEETAGWVSRHRGR